MTRNQLQDIYILVYITSLSTIFLEKFNNCYTVHTCSKLQFKFAIFIFVEHHTICFKAYNSSFIHSLLRKLKDDLKGETDILEVLRFVYPKRTGTQVIDDEI